MTQGVLLCALGTVLIGIVAFQKLDYSASFEQRAPAVADAAAELDGGSPSCRS